MESLGPGEAHVWLTSLDCAADRGLAARYLTLLTPEEIAEMGRFVFERDRDQYLVTRALVRTTLSRYTGVAPAQWRFRRTERGRPEIAAPRLAVPWVFNLSHTDGVVACLVTEGVPAGVDVERLDRRLDWQEIAPTVFSRRELESLARAADARLRFFQLWTLKEAYVKALGIGIGGPLQSFSFDPSSDPIDVQFDPELGEDRQAWQFAQVMPTPFHVLAIALRRGCGPERALKTRWTVPLQESTVGARAERARYRQCGAESPGIPTALHPARRSR